MKHRVDVLNELRYLRGLESSCVITTTSSSFNLRTTGIITTASCRPGIDARCCVMGRVRTTKRKAILAQQTTNVSNS